jgi:hypothetical protein
MSKPNIPAIFSTILAATDAVCAEFKVVEPFRHFDKACWIRDIPIIHDDDVAHVALVLDTERALLVIYVLLQIPEPGERLVELALTTCLANFGLLPGCFELDIDGGDIRYRCVLPLVTQQVCTTTTVAQQLADALLKARAYAPAFQKVVLSDISPEDAIEEVEK